MRRGRVNLGSFFGGRGSQGSEPSAPPPPPPSRQEPKPPPLRRKSSANYRGYAVEPHAKVGKGGHGKEVMGWGHGGGGAQSMGWGQRERGKKCIWGHGMGMEEMWGRSWDEVGV